MSWEKREIYQVFIPEEADSDPHFVERVVKGFDAAFNGDVVQIGPTDEPDMILMMHRRRLDRPTGLREWGLGFCAGAAAAYLLSVAAGLFTRP